MNSRLVGRILILAGIVIAGFGVLLPSYQYSGAFQYLLPPCYATPNSHSPAGSPVPSCETGLLTITYLFFIGLAILAIGVVLVFDANRVDTAWRANP
jgi:hypothetical protein